MSNPKADATLHLVLRMTVLLILSGLAHLDDVRGQETMAERIPRKMQEIRSAFKVKTRRGEDVRHLAARMNEAGSHMDGGRPGKAEQIMDQVLNELQNPGTPVRSPSTTTKTSSQTSSGVLCGRSGTLTVRHDTTIEQSCEIHGTLEILDDAVLFIDYRDRAASSFVVSGDVFVKDRGVLRVHGTATDTFIILNESNEQYRLQSDNDAVVDFKGIEIRTQKIGGKAGSVYMKYDALGSSKMILERATLNKKESWLLGNFKDNSSLKSVNTDSVPTEVYVHDSTSVEISGPDSRTGVWFGAEPMIGEINLPNMHKHYNWEIGRGAGLDVNWFLKIQNAKIGVGLNSYPGSRVTVNGQGRFAELTIGYYIKGGTETLENLTVGLQNGRISDRLTLNNVDLGPIAWQIYVGANDMLTIRNSIINEIGFFDQGHVTVEDSTLQLAVLGLMVPGSTLKIKNSDIWNQYIVVSSNSRLEIEDSNVFGSLIHTQTADAKVKITGGSFRQNPGSCHEGNMVNRETGEPHCNPFRTPGFPRVTGPGEFACQNTRNCR